MARTINRLSHRKVETLKIPGLHSDGGGLYLQVTQGSDGTPRKSWLFRYAVSGRERQMGLGPLADVPLAEARDLALAAREMRRAGKDPITERQVSRAEASLVAAKSMSFDQCATGYIAAHRAGWRNVKHASQWTNTVATYCSPIFGKLPVQLIDVGLVMKAIEPVWSTKPETAGRVRGRIERILDWAKVRGYRDGENPARWRGHLDHLLPARGKVRRVLDRLGGNSEHARWNGEAERYCGHGAVRPIASRNPRRLLSSKLLQSSSGECRLNSAVLRARRIA